MHCFQRLSAKTVQVFIEIPETSWIRGGTPDESRIISWDVQSIDQEDIDFWQGRLESDLVKKAVTALVDELQQ